MREGGQAHKRPIPAIATRINAREVPDLEFFQLERKVFADSGEVQHLQAG